MAYKVPKLKNYVMLLASSPSEPARELENLKGSFLTTNLCSALTDCFDEVDKDNDNKLSIQDVKKWLIKKAEEHNKQFPDLSVPVPYTFGKEESDFIFTVDDPAWIHHEIPWPDGSTMVVLPIRPRDRQVLCIGKYPVTNAQYKKFVESVQGKEPVGDYEQIWRDRDKFLRTLWTGNFYPWQEKEFCDLDKPVVCISYKDAVKYCQWVNRSYFFDFAHTTSALRIKYTRLPTPRLWDFAAFGTESPLRNQPLQDLIAGTNDATLQFHHNSSSPASRDSIGNRLNIRGVSDMFGNVWEWCKETDLILVYPPVFAELRGGGFLDNLFIAEPFLQAANLSNGEDTRRSDLGFRIAATVPIEELPENVQIQLSLCRNGSKDLWQQFNMH